MSWKKLKWELETGLKSRESFGTKKYALTINNGNFFRGFVPCIPPKLRQVVMAKTQETHQSKNASEAAV